MLARMGRRLDQSSTPPRKTAIQQGERAWIETLRGRLESLPAYARARPGVQRGLGDDCAVVRPPKDHDLLVTTDFSLENVHFRRDWHPAASVGHRCLARGLSDLAAMGARPLAAFLSLALPSELAQSQQRRPSWRDRFFAGFLALAENYGVPLAGGDTARAPLLSNPAATGNPARISGLAIADVVLIGHAPRGQALLRSGASPGDCIYVTGYLGGAAAELAMLSSDPTRFRRCRISTSGDPNPHPHLFPIPRLTIAAWLLRNARATAAIDISDGLSTDLDHLCEESGVAAVIDASAIPLHPLAQQAANSSSCGPLQLALNGGEDYELLFTSSPRMKLPRRIAGVPITRIGHIRKWKRSQPRLLLADEHDGRPRLRTLLPGGWEQ